MRVAALDRKLLRDLWRLRWQVLAIALLVACGVAIATMTFSAQKALSQAQGEFYEATRFADVFASAERVPAPVARQLEAIAGVIAVDVRVMETGLMEVPGLERPALARVISLPDDGARALNGLTLARGRMPDPARLDEAVAAKAFLDASGVRLGDRLTAVIGGRAFTFRIVGAVHAPEFIFTPSPGSMLPDDAHQGVFWAPRPAVEHVAGFHRAFNNVSLKLARGPSLPAVLRDVDRILKPYGGTPAYGREDQVSNAFIDGELRELSRSAGILPPLFLLVAAGLVHMVISRLVDSEREQIGLLKAFGYGDWPAAGPYLKLAAAIGLLGVVLGGGAGAGLGALVMESYRQYFRFPTLTAEFSTAAFVVASAVSVAACMAGSLLAVRRAARLSPAIAMQPPKPAAYRASLLDRLTPGRTVDEASRMIVRNLERFPGRAALTAIGLGASLSLLVGTQFVFGSLDYVVDQTYFRSQRWNQAIAFASPRDSRALSEARRLPAVIAAEPMRMVAARISARGVEERIRVTGVDQDATLNRPLDAHGRGIAFKGRGAILSEALARKLKVRPGQSVRLEFAEGRQPAAVLPVTGLAQDFSGYSVYLDRRELGLILGDGDVANGAQLLVAPDRRAAFYRAIDSLPQVVAAASRDDTVREWRTAMTEAFRLSMTLQVTFAAAIAFGVAYNTGRITLSERARDLATLRVLGFSRRDCAYILLGELLVLALVAIPLGLLGGNLLSRGLVAAFSREDMRLPLVMTPHTYAVSLSAFLAAVLLAAGLVGARIWRLDLVAVLKTRE